MPPQTATQTVAEGRLPLAECPARYPSIQTLKAFEAVARLSSFTKAAEELFLTQSAVTHQVRALEDYLNTRLFQRRPRGVELTPAGARIYEGVTMGLLLIGRSLNDVRTEAARC